MILSDFKNEGTDRSFAHEDPSESTQLKTFQKIYESTSLEMLKDLIEKENFDAVLNFLFDFPMKKSQLEPLIISFRKQYDDTNLEIEREQNKSPANGRLIVELDQKFTKISDIIKLLQKKIDEL